MSDAQDQLALKQLRDATGWKVQTRGEHHANQLRIVGALIRGDPPALLRFLQAVTIMRSMQRNEKPDDDLRRQYEELVDDWIRELDP